MIKKKFYWSSQKGQWRSRDGAILCDYSLREEMGIPKAATKLYVSVTAGPPKRMSNTLKFVHGNNTVLHYVQTESHHHRLFDSTYVMLAPLLQRYKTLYAQFEWE